MKDLSPTVYSGSAVAIGFAVCENMSTKDQIVIGNWLMLLGQFIITYSSQESMVKIKKNQTLHKNENDFEKIKDALTQIQKELDKIKPQNK